MKIIKPLLIIVVGYLLLSVGIPFIGSMLHHGTWPVVPTSVMKMYMFFVVSGAILISTFDEEGYNAVVGPIVNLYSDPSKGALRLGVIAIVGVLGAYITYQYVKPTFDAPVELRSIHPAPPSSAKMWNKSFNIQSIKNPYRVEDKAQLAKNTEEGGVVYYQNCFYCHGDRMLGKGPFYDGFNPLPANFVDVGTIAQLSESFVFWRIGTGGPGLPSEGAPWLSAMPIWHTLLSEEQVWKVILFIYDYTGHKPRVMEHGE